MTKPESEVTGTTETLSYTKNLETYLSHARHELRTPLNILLGYSDLLMEEAEERDQVDFKTALQEINLQARAILRTVNLTLDASKNPADFENIQAGLLALAEKLQTSILPLPEEARTQNYTYYLKDLGHLQVSGALLIQYIKEFLAPDRFLGF